MTFMQTLHECREDGRRGTSPLAATRAPPHNTPMPPAPALKDARALLKRVFGYDAFRGLQGDVIAEVLAGRDALAVLPTGGGKSLCYQIPALLRAGVGARRLAADRADAGSGRGAAHSRACAAARLDSDDSMPTTRARRWQRSSSAASSICSMSRPKASCTRHRWSGLAAHADRADRHRRGALRQPMGP